MLQLHLLELIVIGCAFIVECRVANLRKLDLDRADKGPRVLLSVSSLASHDSEGTITERLLELNWFDAPKGMNEDPTSWVGLFDHDPSEGIGDALEIAATKSWPSGYYRTKVKFPRITFAEDKLTDACLGYWIGYVNLNHLVAKSCIRPRPHWMYEMREVIGNQTLQDLMLPGTHNAGSYQHYNPNKNSNIIRYQMCHDEDIYNQLVYGNRFLDLRVLFQHVAGSKEKFWISHGIFRTNNTLRSVMSQVKRFLDNTNEIVVIDFHLFYMGFFEGMVENRHKDLINLLTRNLGQYMIPLSFDYTTKLNELWKTNKRLFVGYAAPQRLESTLLFPGVFHLWGNKDSKEQLEDFFRRNLCYFRYGNLWAAMAELTPSTAGVFLDKYGGLRKMAQDVNADVTRWFRERWWNCANIVATDYFLGNNIIDVSIEVNHKKFKSLI